MTQPQGSAAGFPGGVRLSHVAAPFLSFLFFLAIFFLPVLGMALNFFAPLPLVYYFFTQGRKPWHLAAFAVTVAIAIFFGFNLGMFYLLSYCLMALLIAEMIQRKEEMVKVIGIAAFVPLVVTGSYFLLSSPVPIGELYSALLAKAIAMINQTVSSSRDSGMPREQAEYILQYSTELAIWLIKLLPAIAGVGYLLLSCGNFIAYRRIQSKYSFLPPADPTPLKLWSPPERLVFLLIVSIAMLLAGYKGSDVIGANLTIVLATIYVLGGVSVMEFFMEKFHVPFFLRLMAYMLIIIQPLFLFIMAGLGLFDLWFDFRKIRVSEK